jgi:glycosyltransferase involved in cell wall biosynthesis
VNGAAAITPAEPAEPQLRAVRPLRILAVGNMYPPHHAGGYEIMWQAAMAQARRLGHEVRILVSDYRASGSAAESEPDVHRTLRWYWDLERYEFPHLTPGQRLGLERHNAAQLGGHLRTFAPDLVSWWSMGCMSLSLIEQVRRAGLPGHFVVHDDWLVYGPQQDQWLRMWRGRRRLLAPMAERLFGVPTRVSPARSGPLVFNSRYTLERARRAGCEAASMTVVYPGIDESLITLPTQQPWGWRLAYVGRLDRQKGIDTAIRALARLPAQATLAIWGTGDVVYRGQCLELALTLGVGDRVHFAGWADPQQRALAYRESDVVVFPVRWEEPFGLVPLEAMAAGRPVVSTARGGTSEFVRNGENALVFDPDDDAALAACVARLAQDDGLRAALVRAGGQTAARFTITRFAQETVAEIVAAAGRRGQALTTSA